MSETAGKRNCIRAAGRHVCSEMKRIRLDERRFRRRSSADDVRNPFETVQCERFVYVLEHVGDGFEHAVEAAGRDDSDSVGCDAGLRGHVGFHSVYERFDETFVSEYDSGLD